MTEPKVLWQQLQQAGLVAGAQPPLADRNPQPAFFSAHVTRRLRLVISAVFLWFYFRCFCQFPLQQPKHLGAGHYPLRRQCLDQSS